MRLPMNVTLPDGTALELPEGATGADAAAAIGEGLARAALAVQVNGDLRDLGRPLEDGVPISIITPKSPEALELIRHDTAHVLAAAILDLYPGTKISIGPPIEDGFYYDFEFPEGVTVTEADFPAIEERMRAHVKADEPFVREDVSVEDALERFRSEHQDYKVELIEDLVSRRGRADRLALHQRPVHRPLPRPALAVDQAHQGLPAAVGGRRLLARGLRPPDAHPHLRHRVLLQGGPRGAPRGARAGARPRPPQARPRARASSRSPSWRPGMAFWLPPGTARLQRARGAQPAHAAGPRLRRGQDAAALRLRSSGRPRATGASTGRTSSSPSTRTGSSA